MLIKDLLLPEFDQEMAATRRMLERVPEDRLEWQPHPKSMTLQALLSHVVNIPTWVPFTLDHAELDMMPEGKPWTTPQQTVRETWMATFEASVAAARLSLDAATDACMEETWTLKGNGQVYFSALKRTVLRSFVFNHLVHHRAQLGVYLRLLDIPVPGVYGPSADEQGM